MTPQEFCYWLNGYFELAGDAATLSPDQTRIIRNHLALVFHHSIDPAQGLTPEQAAEAQAIHDGHAVDPSRPPAPWLHPPGPGGMLMRC